MKIIIKTLVDITETGARRGEDPLRSKQQANYNTIIQTAGFRANLVPNKCVKHVSSLKDLNFGDFFKGNQSWWEISFHLDYAEAITDEMLINDFSLVPFISGLEETVKFEKDVFITLGSKKNIFFEFEQ